MKFGSWRVTPGPPNATTVCGTSSGIKARCGGLAASMSGTGVRLALAGNPPNVLSSSWPSAAGATSPTTVILQCCDSDSGNSFQGPVGLPARGVVAEGDFQELAAGE